jgi:DNA-binding LacI/PurR family transcriptional regulator/signal transduction histidine kinase/ActR/RegA family two-component response regulator
MPVPFEPPSPRRLRIAVLLDHLNSFSGGYEAQLRDAIHAKCREAGHHLLLVYGGPLEAPNPLDAADNAIYDLFRSDSVDGLIIVSSLLSTYGGSEGVARMVAHLQQAKMCSVGIELPGIPSLILDNRPGMEAVVEHLIVDHGCRKLAFLAGTEKNPEAEVRLEAYRAVLERHGIGFDPDLVARGYFRPNLAKVAMEEILGRGVTIDGVVAANDEMATGAIDLLRNRGLRVPQDIPVTGFDDLLLARLGNPPLTTVAQPYEQVADWAVMAIEEQIAGGAMPECTQVAPRFVRRQSCGCGHEVYRRDAAPVAVARPAQTGSIVDRLGTLMPALRELLRTGFSSGGTAATRLLDGLCAEIDGQRDAFQQALVGLLETAGADSERQRLLQSAICYLRDELRSRADLRLERVLFDGLNLVAAANSTSQIQHRLLLDENYLRLLSVGEQASIAFDLASLRDALVKGLPNAGVRTAYLACVTGEPGTALRPVMCLRDGVLMGGDDDLAYPASQLLPPGALTEERRETFLVFPLAFENQLLGVIAFNYSDGINGYAAFRNEIAAALKSIRLREELVQKSLLHERSVQERLAATKRMEALSVLAGGVAHDLNNALGPLVALPDVILAQLRELPAVTNGVGRDLHADVETIKVAALRAAQTIKDLLTLGRQGRMAKENLDINRVIKSCLANSSLRFVEDGSARVNMIADLAPAPLLIRGSESQLARAVDNLLRNAVEAIAGNGEVVVKSARLEVREDRAGFETIPAGHYATLSVSDDGCGIDSRELGQVFEPFFTKKRAKETSGSGLGLAIVHGVVKEHEGFIDVTSTPGVGTTISLYVPLVDGAERTGRVVSAPRGNARILIVDDEPIQLRTGRRVLVRLGYQVEIMESGLRAYELFSRAAASGQSPFDLVIMDMLLGEVLDGLQIIDQIQRLFPDQRAIVVSGHAPTERAELAVKKGLSWLGKPYDIDTLAETVARALRDEVTSN